MTKTVTHFDRKVLSPSDMFKTARGYVIVEDSKGNRQGENLVVLAGREFLASKLMNMDSPAFTNSHMYELRYMGIGKGGASDDANGDPTVKNGPYADDTDLYDPLKINDGNSGDGKTYVDNGYLKYILADDDAKIEFLIEDHDIENADGTTTVQSYTIVKFTMFIKVDEMTDQRTFEFNEAGLWAVEYDSDGNVVTNEDGTANKRLFAHFTTASKFIEDGDELKIEWYILV